MTNEDDDDLPDLLLVQSDRAVIMGLPCINPECNSLLVLSCPVPDEGNRLTNCMSCGTPYSVLATASSDHELSFSVHWVGYHEPRVPDPIDNVVPLHPDLLN
jgi:hypothetical protein